MPELETGAAPAAPEAAVVANSTPEVTSTPDDTMAAVFDKHYPTERVNRAENGKFISKNPAEGAVTAEPAKEINQEPVADKLETVTADTPTPSTKLRPQSWSADLDEFWNSLPPERQDFFAKREGESHQKITQLGEKASVADKYAAIIDRHKSLIGQNRPEAEIDNLFQTKAALLRDPVGSLKWLAQQLGVDPSQFALAQNGEQPAENDQFRSLTQEIAQLKRQLGETTQRLTARERSENDAREQSLASLVDEFKTGKDYWPDIEGEVLAQIHAIKAAHPNKDPKEVLQDAHDRAVKLNDEVSNKLTKAKRDKEAADKTAEEKRKADEAKRLASLNTKSSSGSTPKAAKNIDAELEEIYDKVAARG